MMRNKLTILTCVLLAALSGNAQSPAEVEGQILAKLKTISETGTYSGNYSDDDGVRNSTANKQLTDLLLKEGKRVEILKYAFPKLNDQMGVATSKDGRLRIYSWDTETGGSMHEYSSVVQYQGASGRVYTWTYDPPVNEPGNSTIDTGVGTGGYYMRILQVDTPRGAIYLAISLFIACGQCHGQSVEAARIEGESLLRAAKAIKTASGMTNSIDFAYAPVTIPRSLSADRLVRFDAEKKSFSIPVVLEDDEAFNGRLTTRTITYRFNGTYFVKVT